MRRILLTGWVLAAASLAGTGTVSEAAAQAVASQDSAARSQAVLDRLEDVIQLTEEQREAVRELVAAQASGAREPGASWRIAAGLRDILTADQIETLRADVTQWTSEGGDPGWTERGAPPGGRRAPAGARPERGMGPDAMGRGAAHGMQGLDLSEAQVAKIDSIRDGFRPRLEELRSGVEDGSIERDEARERADAIRQEMHDAIQGVLTEEQRARVAERAGQAAGRRQERRAMMGERRSGVMEGMKEALQLTEEQVSALETLHQSFRSQGPPADAEARAARRQAHQAAVREILTAEQEQIWVLHQALGALRARQGPMHGAGSEAGGPHGTGARAP